MVANHRLLTELRWVVILPLAAIAYLTVSTAVEIVGVFRITHFETQTDAFLISGMFGIVLLFGVTCFWLCAMRKRRARPFTIVYLVLPLILNFAGIFSGQLTPLITAMLLLALIVFLAVSQRAKQTFVR